MESRGNYYFPRFSAVGKKSETSPRPLCTRSRGFRRNSTIRCSWNPYRQGKGACAKLRSPPSTNKFEGIKIKTSLSLSLSTTFETHASNDETHTSSLKAKSGREWADGGWELDVKYLLVISGESARMDRRLIVVTYAFPTRDICRATKRSKKSYFFSFSKGESRTRDDLRHSHVFFLQCFPLSRESRVRNESICSGPRRVIYLFLVPSRERNRITYYVSRDYGLHSRAINERGPPDR